ncbi:MAG: hypothetical protein JJO71_37915 [Escherichia coli]|nr:hypothetical protein [Escherichia coli]
MDEIYNEFERSIAQIRQTNDVYKYLKDVVKLNDAWIDDILRSQIVNVISALDRYLHEKVRKGICDMFLGNRDITNKFKSFSVSSDTVLRIWGDSSLTIIDREILINEVVIQSLKTLSFQKAIKIKDALSYLWDEPHKMVIIAKEMEVPGITDNDKQRYLTQKLDLMVERRNQIAHESDIYFGVKRSICQDDVIDAITFIEKFVSCLNEHI